MRSIVIGLLFFVAVTAQADSGVRSGRLNNGMDVVLVENHSVPMIAANIIVKTGARDETWQTWGAAHYLEHLLFNGTKNRTQEEIYAAFDRIGAYHNAHTGSHFTDFMVLTESSNFETGFDILAEMVFESTLPAHKVEKERGIVIEEIARSQTSGDDAGRSLDELLYGRTPLAREVLGTTESIARLDRDSVWAFYKRWYQPNNSMLFATGDFDADSLFDWFQARLSKYPPAELPPRSKIEAPDFSDFSSLGTVVKEATSRQRRLTVAMSAPKPGSPDFIPFMMQLRALDKRFEASLPAGVSGGTDLSLDPDVSVVKIMVSAQPDGPSALDLQKLLDAELKRLVEKAPDATEIARLAKSYLAEQVYNTERLHYYGMMYAPYWAVVPWDEFASWNDRLTRVKSEELKIVASKWLLSSDRLTFVVEPKSKSETIADNEARGSARLEPEGGPLVIVRSDPTAHVFAVHVLAKDRYLWDRAYETGRVDLLHRSLAEATSSGSRIGDRLENLAATIKLADEPSIPYDDYYTAPEFSFVRLELLPEGWKEGIDLLAELLMSTPLTDANVTSARVGSEAALASSERSPAGIGLAHIRSTLAGSKSLSARTYGDVSKVTSDDLEALRKGYLHPANLIITISGPEDADKVAEHAVKAFQSRSKVAFQHPDDWDKPVRSLRAVSMHDTLTLGRQQGAVVMGRIISPIEASDRAALTIANSWFSDRMASVLRESRGLAYSLGSSLNFQKGENGELWALWEISIGTRPEKLKEAEDGIGEILSELQTHTFTADEVERLGSAISGRLMMRDMARIGQAFAMGIGELYWNDPDSRAKLVESLKTVTPEAARAAATKYLTQSGMMTVIVK